MAVALARSKDGSVCGIGCVHDPAVGFEVTPSRGHTLIALGCAPCVAPTAPDKPCRPVEFSGPVGVQFACAQLEPVLLLAAGRAQFAVFEPPKKAQFDGH